MKIAVLMTMACLAAVPASAALPPPTDGPALDLDIAYYTRVLTPEGVTREARYGETMIRRAGHVWVARILPNNPVGQQADDVHDKSAKKEGTAGHVEFNHVVIPRHVMLENNKVRIEYVDANGKAVVAIPASEYANVNFDGSWGNAFFLLDPKLVMTLPRSARKSAIPSAQWRERERNGIFERVLWDEKRQIPLIIESGDSASTFYRRVEVTPRPTQAQALPWQGLQGYSQKEYSDYLD
jgi:hypothetical protein